MKCENPRCSREHDGKYGSGRFCSKKCSCTHLVSEETKRKISKSVKSSEALKQFHQSRRNQLFEYRCEKCSSSFTSKKRHWKKLKVHCEKCKRKVLHHKEVSSVNSIWELSSTTRLKIIQRLKLLSCSICGWDRGRCDVHHIFGKKIENSDRHSNLSVLCPNCHRLAHMKKIKPEEIPNLENALLNWRDFYYQSGNIPVGSL